MINNNHLFIYLLHCSEAINIAELATLQEQLFIRRIIYVIIETHKYLQYKPM